MFPTMLVSELLKCKCGAVFPRKAQSCYDNGVTKDATNQSRETDRQNLVCLELGVGNVRLDLLDDSNRDVVLVKGPQAL